MNERTKKKILILENAVDITGGFKSIINSSIVLKDDFDFVIAVPDNSRCIEYAKSRGIQVVEFPYYELSKNIFSWFIYLPFLLINTVRLKRFVRQMNIDLIIANDFYNLLPCSNRFFGGKVPYVCFVRFLPNRFPNILVNAWSRLNAFYATHIIVVSEAVKRQLKSDNKIRVVYEGLPKSMRENLNGAETNIEPSQTILYLSNYINGKGHQYALESFQPLAAKYPAWKIRFVGGDMGMRKNKAYKEYLINRATELNIHEQVEWKAFEENVNKEYLSASIVLNFSDSESFSLTCLEAMSAGRPVIATDSGGPSEIIDTMQNGILVPVGDISAMTKAIDFLISHSEMRENMGKAAHMHIQSKFGHENTFEKLRIVYLESMDK